ncbi:MAG: glycosyltransferase [Gammaproteobacteria bacterium]|nr:glycosyltransferase [Gammaproteobacteria bacterium]
MRKNTKNARVLIYSHDTFGLGHLRRCHTIAQSLVARRKGLSVLILSGSPIIGSFDFRSRVDFVRIPGVIKLRNGEYSSLSLHIDMSELLEMRASIIQHTAKVFNPDVFLVDKEPLGLRGEIHQTLHMLKRAGTQCVLGLRDIMDDPILLAREWRRKNPVPALRDLYDEIWVYGLPQICNPLAGIDLPETVRAKITYTGYLRRNLPEHGGAAGRTRYFDEPYLLVTTGGGGDGELLIDWVLRAYEADCDIPYPALLVFGPFMAPRRREYFHKRVSRLAQVKAITFDTEVESLMAGAVGVVAMGGYNTFCEILSFDKRALLIPRTKPRQEQVIRASRAHELGLVRMLTDEEDRDPERMARALCGLATQNQPSDIVIPGLLDGLDNIYRMVDAWLPQTFVAPIRVAT